MYDVPDVFRTREGSERSLSVGCSTLTVVAPSDEPGLSILSLVLLGFCCSPGSFVSRFQLVNRGNVDRQYYLLLGLLQVV